MEWILDHLQILIAAGAAVAYWLNQRQQANAENESQDESFDREASETDDDAEHARRIREEIRRKIAERVGGGIFESPPNLAPPPLFRPAEDHPQPAFEPVRQEKSRNQGSGYLVEADPAVLEHQRKLKEQLLALNKAKESAKQIIEPVRKVVAPIRVRRRLQHDLRDTRSIRRAIVLREVLGPPVALR